MIKLKDLLTEAPKKNKWKIQIEVEIPEGKGYHYLYNRFYGELLSGYEKYYNWKIKKLNIKQ